MRAGNAHFGSRTISAHATFEQRLQALRAGLAAGVPFSEETDRPNRIRHSVGQGRGRAAPVPAVRV